MSRNLESSRTRTTPSWIRKLLVGAVALAVVSACGSGAGSDGAAGETPESVVSDAEAAVAVVREGTDRPLPETAPKPMPGQNVWMISCMQGGEGCAVPANAAVEAGKLLGWKMTLFDGKGRPDLYANGIRAAIADKADGVILGTIDCVAAKSALEDAREAGIKVFAYYSFDCDDPILATQSEPLFDATIDYGTDAGYGEYLQTVQLRHVVDYLIAQTGGKAKIIEFVEDDIVVAQHIGKGFAEQIKRCTGCEIVKQVPITLDDFATGKLSSKADAALTQHPDATVIMAPYDSALSGGISQAVVKSGRNDDILVLGNEGMSPNVEMIRSNSGQDFTIGNPARWVGWAAIDGMNRLLQGEPQVDQGIGYQILDAESALPKATPFYDGNIDADGVLQQDYQANFEKIWGLRG